MLDLNDLYLFVQVADRGGFTAAGRALQIPKSTLSYRVQQLETQLGARLLNRTSRSFRLTDAGTEFYQHAVTVVQRAEAAETAIKARLVEPSGTVRFTAGIATMQFGLRDLLPSFLNKYPKVHLFAQATDEPIDIVAENFDLAIRAHSEPLPDATLVARTLVPAPWFLFAGANYLHRHGTPQTLDELAGRPTLFMTRTTAPPRWCLRHNDGRRPHVVIPLTPRLTGNDMVSLKQAAAEGQGIVALPGYVCRDMVATGLLRRILPDWISAESTLTALFPSRQGQLPSVRAFLDHLAAELPKVVTL